MSTFHIVHWDTEEVRRCLPEIIHSYPTLEQAIAQLKCIAEEERTYSEREKAARLKDGDWWDDYMGHVVDEYRSNIAGEKYDEYVRSPGGFLVVHRDHGKYSLKWMVIEQPSMYEQLELHEFDPLESDSARAEESSPHPLDTA